MSNIVNKAEVALFVAARWPAQYEGVLPLWSKQNPNQTEFFAADENEALMASIVRRGSSEDIYIAGGIQREKLSSSERGKTEGIIAISGLFADIDTQIGKESPRGYCDTKEEAQRILDDFPLAPSIVIDSGNGLQAHWLFPNLVVFDNEEHKKRVQEVARAFQMKLRAHYAEHGKTIDSVHDLARVFRIPGTFNHKNGEAKPVVALKYNDYARYSLAELEAFAPTVRKETVTAVTEVMASDHLPADHNKIVKGCDWYRKAVVEGASDCSEPNWHAAASIAVRCEGGREKFHAFSSKHHQYSPKETDEKLDRGLSESGPRTCKSICDDLGNEAHCHVCPHFGKITSPIQLGQKKKRPPAAKDAAIAVVLDNAELFHDEGGTAFMSVQESGGIERTNIINSSGGKNQIRHLYYQATGKSLSSQAVGDIVGLLESKALFDGPCQEVCLREGWADGKIYIDLGNDKGSIVCISADGWTVDNQSPVKFLQSKGFGSLPLPSKDGNVHLFRDFLGLPHDLWPGLLAFIISCAHPGGPYFHLMIEGEHGSGKSFTSSCVKNLLDPAMASRVILPKNERDLMVIANSNRILSFDNISNISGPISDVLCTLATGGGLIGRKLFSDADPFIMNCTRPVIMNGITSMIYRPDLMDRTLPVFLPAIEEGSKKPQADLLAEFERILPRILGGLYDIISAALLNMDKVQAPTNIRMADCAKWLVAAEPATGFPEGTFLKAVLDSQRMLVLEQMSTHPVVLRLYELLRHGPYKGTLGRLHENICNSLGYKEKEFIGQTASVFSNKLKRLKSSLHTVGIEFSLGNKNRVGKMVEFWLTDRAMQENADNGDEQTSADGQDKRGDKEF